MTIGTPSKPAPVWIGGTCLALLAALLLFSPAPALAADNWSGIWHTKHKFGNPKLELELIQKPGDDVVKGVYYDNGELRGRIRGKREKDGAEDIWSGTFRDIGASSKGKFSVVLLSDQVSFRGWFKTCGRFLCSERYKWTGEHA